MDPIDDALFLSVNSVNGNALATGDFLFAADGNIALTAPKAETYAMMLADFKFR
ncbi:MAG: hypothetical protein KJ889_11925 [Gammaproteobacteria bacterium]|nr:hypothetical protein [Gammaproteobacteria bacterium]